MKTKAITIRVPVITLPKVTLPITVARNPDFQMPRLPKLRLPLKISRKATEE
jgi:hypothetical protein